MHIDDILCFRRGFLDVCDVNANDAFCFRRGPMDVHPDDAERVEAGVHRLFPEHHLLSRHVPGVSEAETTLGSLGNVQLDAHLPKSTPFGAAECCVLFDLHGLHLTDVSIGPSVARHDDYSTDSLIGYPV